MLQPDKELYEFSRFRLDVSERLLQRDGKRVALTDKAFDTLCLLVRHGGELVGKDELMNEVWADSIVEENNLDQKISMLRQALGERGGKGKEKFIETVRGHGYRFLPEVRRVEVESREWRVASKSESQIEHFKSQGSSESQISDYKLQNKSQSEIEHVQSEITKAPKPNPKSKVVALADWRNVPEEVKNLKETEAETRHGEKQIEPLAESKFLKLFKQNKRITIFAAASFIIVAIAVFAGSRFSDNQRQTSDALIDSIAVLPFVNESGNADNEYLSDGMTESLISSLSQLPKLSVKARSSVFRYKGKDVSPQTVGNELAVQAVLFGRVTQRNDLLTLSLELVDAKTGNQIWGERYNHQQTELLSLQSEIARDVSNKLRTRLSNADEQRVTKTYTANPEAYQLYLQGLYHWNKRTAEDIRKSIALFGQAIDKDPLYAKAYAGLASAYLILPDYSKNLTRQEIKEVDLKRRGALRQAQELDDSLAEVHAVLATLKEDAWDFAAAESEYRRAINLNPNFASAHQWYSRLLGAMGRHEEAFAEINQAHELDPFSRSINFNIGGRFSDARRFDEAIAQYQKVIEMEPNHPLTHFVLAQAYEAKGRYPEAIAETRTADVLLEKESAATAERKAAAFTQALKTGGAQGYWRKRLELSLKEYNEGYGSAYKIAVNYARLGDQDRAFEQLEKSFAAREVDLIWIKTEPAFDGLSSDPRFQDLLRRIGL